MFDLTQLRCFITVAEELHFGRAAARLNMTQPPLSRQIQVLERVVGAPLLERSSRSVHLTAAGKSFLPEARGIIRLATSASELVRRIAAGKSGFFKLGFTAGAAYEFLPKLLRACRERLPEIEFALKEMVSGDQIEALAMGQIDAALLRPPVARAEFASRLLVSEPLLAAIPREHRLAEAAILTIRDFDGEPFVMYSPHGARYFNDLLTSQFLHADVTPRYVEHMNQIHSILAMVQAGLGLSIVPESAAILRFVDVRYVPLSLAVPAHVELCLCWRQNDDSLLLSKLIDIASGVASTLNASKLTGAV